MTDAAVTRLILHPIAWPKDHHERPTQELKWRVTLDGEEILAQSKRPFEDAAAIIADRGGDPDSLITFRHADKPHDSFRPMPLSKAAKAGLKRMESARKMRAYFESKRAEEAATE